MYHNKIIFWTVLITVLIFNLIFLFIVGTILYYLSGDPLLREEHFFQLLPLPVIYSIIIIGLSSVASMLYALYRAHKQVDKINKGQKLMEITEQKPFARIEIKAYSLIAINWILINGFIVIEYGLVRGELRLIALVGMMIVFLSGIHFLFEINTPQKRLIYEKGLKFDFGLIEWQKITACQWQNSCLVLKTKGLPGKIVIKDPAGSVKNLVAKYITNAN
ncbi:MAG: hypothetical protein LRZ99_05550 [Desulfotomaculum sp.]|nr:hypothetical protein [Desulfotomaculum sp.]